MNLKIYIPIRPIILDISAFKQKKLFSYIIYIVYLQEMKYIQG